MGANRRESMPMMGGAPRPYPDFGTHFCPRMPLHTTDM